MPLNPLKGTFSTQMTQIRLPLSVIELNKRLIVKSATSLFNKIKKTAIRMLNFTIFAVLENFKT